MNKKDLQNAIREFLSKDGNSPITEANLTKVQLDKREDYLKQLKKNKKELVKRYGKDAESVMYGRATNLAKKAVSEMDKQKLKELVRKSLTNEADLEVMADKIGGEDELSLASNLLDDFESKLKSHDWYYMMSDDNRAYTKGSAEESELKKIAKQLASMGYDKDAANLYNKYNVFKATTFDSFITPPEPFIPMYKRKQMGLDEEAEFSKEYDNNPALKGGQKKLPDALQKSIIKKGAKNEILYNPGEIHGEYEIGDIVKYNGEDHEVTRVEVDRIYIRPVEPSSILGKKDSFWVKKNDLNEDIDLGHEDNEPHMIKGELYQIGKYAMKLYAVLEELEETGEEIDFPAWWQSKITTAKNMMSSARHYLDFELKEPYIDAAVDAATGEAPHMGEPEAPMMEAEIGKDEMLAGKIMKALKDMANKDASDQNNLKQARIALNKGNTDAAEKIAKPYLSEKITKYLKENISLKKGDTVEYEGNKYKIGSFDTEANLVYLNTMDNKPAEDSKGSYLKVNATRVKKTK